MRILLVDDETGPRRVLERILESIEEVTIYQAASLAEAREQVASRPIDVAFIDIRLDAQDSGNRDGLKLMDELRGRVIGIMVTHISEMETIRQAMRGGAFDYILKDSLDVRNKDLFRQILKSLRQVLTLEREVVRLRTRAAADDLPWTLVGTSAVMERLRRAVQRVALSDKPVLVVGPSGSGKEPVVRAIHAWGAHADEPFVAINCGAVPEPLFESELFGHEKGAFTGADKRREGQLSAVGRGTLFLDEVAELPAPLQAKLLRLLETGRFRPVGRNEESAFEGRVVAATHVDLASRVREGRFREDLLYRLDVLPVRVPSLEERREDIPLLVAHFAGQQGRHVQFSPEALEELGRWPWPGNVRQLRTLVQRVSVFSEDELITVGTLASLRELTGSPEAAATSSKDPWTTLATVAERVLDLPLGDADRLLAIESALVAAAMSRAGHVKTRAANLLGVHRKRIERAIERDNPDSGGDDSAGGTV